MSISGKALMGVAVLVGAVACGGSSGGGNGAGAGTGGAGVGPVQHPTSLKGEVGKDDAYKITLTDQDGKAIKNLAAGSYKLDVEDYSTIHNFHLGGNGVSDATTIGGKTEKTFTVNFTAGDYTFVCDAHVSQMSGQFHVT